MDILQGSVERITYYNPENGYSVIRLRPAQRLTVGVSRDGLVTATGNLPELSPGEHLKLSGKWVTHPKHGAQFSVEICEQTLPATLSGIHRYLGSGLIKGIGSRLANRIVQHFGAQTLEIIENQPERLREVQDIGAKRAAMIAAAWEEQRQVKEIMLFLHSYNVSTNLAIKIYKHYGEQALQIVQSDPYRLAQDIYGVGFKTADRIAQSMGLAPDHPSRIEAGVVYSLNQTIDDGHVFFPFDTLVDHSARLLAVAPEQVPPAIDRLTQAKRIRQETIPYQTQDPPEKTADTTLASEAKPPYGQAAIYLSPLFFSEIGVAERLRQLASAFPSRLSDIPPVFMTLDPQLSPEQASAIRTAVSNPVSVLTGGPGTGKTTALRALISILESANKRYALACPTGRAAKRLSQATGRSASTIHRLLSFSPSEGFKHNAENPLEVDMLVVDEASMLDLSLANHLLKAVTPGAHLLLVGDVDQLPSVGAGDVLRDVIDSQLAPVTRLHTIFRQAERSYIITNAHRINRGQMPKFPSPDHASAAGWPGDFFLFSAETPEQAADWVTEIVCERIPRKFGFHPRDEIQVLAPMYRGAAGVSQLNDRLQAKLNPADGHKPQKRLFGQLFRPGDKVMQTQNNYDKDVFNGDIGNIFSIDLIEQTLTVDFEGRAVAYDWNEADQLLLAYAISVHKSQGSEFPAVVIPLVTQHYLMLQRNLLYTAVTRARKLCVLAGSRRAIHMAIRNDKVAQRHSALAWRLKS